MDNFAGQTIKGYELRHFVAAGGFGAVYRAFQTIIKREVAVKIILPALANQPDFIRRFEAEAQLVARLEHPFIVPLYDYWRDPSGAYLVMRWLAGGSLREHLKKGALDLETTSKFLDQIAAALTVAHRNGVIHRDLKPENILLDLEGNAYLADFGIAKSVGPEASEDFFDKQLGAVVGTPAYIAPEQIKSQPVTPQTDIYGLGNILYELLTGSHPFPQSSTSELLMQHLSEPLPLVRNIRTEMPPQIDDVIQKATAKNPTERFADALSMAAALRKAITPAVRDTPVALGGEESDELIISISRSTGTISIDTDLLDMAEPVNPYKGLRAFQESDSDDFFGREALVQKLLDRLQEPHPLARFLAVVGPSGSGKSSVVKAGVIPALRKNAIPGSDKWFVVEMLPGLHPLDEIESALLKIAVTPPVGLSDLLRTDEKGLGQAVKNVLPDDDTELLLVIDQFEEVFTQVESENERTHILNSLRAAVLDPASRLRVIVTLRADFYDRPLNYEGFGSLMRDRTEVVLPLSAEELQQAIAGPAERVGLLVEPALVAEMVSEIQDEPGALPLLQYALTEVFEKREGITLTLDAYRASGGALGALAHRAEELYQTFNEEQQATTRQIFLRLVTLGEGTEDTRRRVLWAELIAIEGDDDTVMQAVLELYGKYRLLTFGADPQTREPTVEVAHEALIRQWQRLREWLNESRESVRLQRRLIAALSDWQNQGRDASFLASGTRLVQYESLLESTNLALTANEQTYIRASISARDEKAAAEEARRERELALERQAKRRLRVLLAVMAAALVGAFILSIFAFNQQREARQERDNARLARDDAQRERDNARQSGDEAKAQALAASAQILLTNNDTDAALVLAMEALKIEPDLPAVEPALANAAYTPATRLVMEGNEDIIYVVKYSPDGRTALSGSHDSIMRLWDIETGREIRRFEEDLGWILGIAYSPDGRQAVAAYDQARVLILWDLETGEEIRRFTGHTDYLLAVDYSPDGKYLASGSSDNTVLVWDVQTGEIVHRMAHADAVNAVIFSPDGRYLASGSDDETIVLWDVATGEQLRVLEGHTSGVISLDFSLDGQLLFSGADYPDSTPRLWDVATGEQLRVFRGHTDVVASVALSPNGQYGLSSSGDTTIRLWNIATGQEIQRYVGHKGMVYSVAFSPDSRRILSGGDDRVLREWWVENAALVHRLEGHEGLVWKAIFSPDGRTIASASVDETIKLWDAQTGELTNELGGDIGEVIAVSFNRDGTQLFSTSNQPDNRVRLWNVATGTVIHQYRGHTGGVNDAVFLPDEKTFVSGDGDGRIIRWDVETGEILNAVQTDEAVNKIVLSQDGTLMVSSHMDNSVILWDLRTWRIIHYFEGHTAPVYTVEFSADNRYLLSASTDRTARLWEVATGREVRRFTGNNSAVYGATFSPDNRFILLALADGTAILEDAVTGNPLRIYTGHHDAVESVAFSPDGKMAVTTSDDATIIVWRIDTSLDEIVEWVRANRYLREPTCGERAQYRIDPLCIGGETP